MNAYKQKARDFLSIASHFQLGALSTEKEHPLTENLSHQAVHELPGAIAILKEIDVHALRVLQQRVEQLHILADRMKATLESGHRIFLCGCGATGRLSLTLESLWRDKYAGDARADKVLGFMAGGDVALIQSIESFEDYLLFGVKQLFEMNFIEGDLLISCTEGGETPFVIGATETAARLSSNKPFFLYCNPDDILCEVADRSRRVIKKKYIEKINLDVGPMALTGSTRMQASTVLMAAVGFSLFYHDAPQTIAQAVAECIDFWESLDTGFLEDFIIKESQCYQRGEYLLYDTDEHFGITILTDTTERSPTFSLYPFENARDRKSPVSLCYIYFPMAKDSITAWEMLLHRKPRTLQWDDIKNIASYKRLLGFNFSRKLLDRRSAATNNALHHHFRIYKTASGIHFELEDARHVIPTGHIDTLCEHLILKMLLNTHSTLVMGRLGRYERNIMTWVRPSNNKLIDRTIRYVDFLLQEKGITLSYEKIAYACFRIMETLPGDQSLVCATVNALVKESQ